MEQNLNQEQKKPRRGASKFLAVLNILLLLALAAVLGYHFLAQRRQSVEAMAQQQELAQTKAQLEELEETTIPVETFKGYVQQYSPSTEFIQQFFPDKLVYKDETGVVYADIDESLPKNDYDWQYLSRNGKRYSYAPPEGQAALLGIDVSAHQGDIDWQAVKDDGIGFAMIRLAYRGYGASGNLLVDQNYEANIDGALDAGLDVGVYVFSQAITEEEAVEEANLAIENLKGRDITFPVVFDMEEIAGSEARTYGMTPEQVTDIAIAFCETIEAAGYRPMIYGNLKWLAANMDLSRLTEYDTWLAQYYRTPAFPYDFQMWQYTNTGSVAGINGDVDLNLCFTRYPAQ